MSILVVNFNNSAQNLSWTTVKTYKESEKRQRSFDKINSIDWEKGSSRSTRSLALCIQKAVRLNKNKTELDSTSKNLVLWLMYQKTISSRSNPNIKLDETFFDTTKRKLIAELSKLKNDLFISPKQKLKIEKTIQLLKDFKDKFEVNHNTKQNTYEVKFDVESENDAFDTEQEKYNNQGITRPIKRLSGQGVTISSRESLASLDATKTQFVFHRSGQTTPQSTKITIAHSDEAKAKFKLTRQAFTESTKNYRIAINGLCAKTNTNFPIKETEKKWITHLMKELKNTPMCESLSFNQLKLLHRKSQSEPKLLLLDASRFSGNANGNDSGQRFVVAKVFKGTLTLIHPSRRFSHLNIPLKSKENPNGFDLLNNRIYGASLIQDIANHINPNEPDLIDPFVLNSSDKNTSSIDLLIRHTLADTGKQIPGSFSLKRSKIIGKNIPMLAKALETTKEERLKAAKRRKINRIKNWAGNNPFFMSRKGNGDDGLSSPRINKICKILKINRISLVNLDNHLNLIKDNKIKLNSKEIARKILESCTINKESNKLSVYSQRVIKAVIERLSEIRNVTSKDQSNFTKSVLRSFNNYLTDFLDLENSVQGEDEAIDEKAQAMQKYLKLCIKLLEQENNQTAGSKERV